MKNDPGYERMLRFPCGYCGVGPGEPCLTKSGTKLSIAHGDRFQAATAAGLLPLTNEELPR